MTVFGVLIVLSYDESFALISLLGFALKNRINRKRSQMIQVVIHHFQSEADEYFHRCHAAIACAEAFFSCFPKKNTLERQSDSIRTSMCLFSPPDASIIFRFFPIFKYPGFFCSLWTAQPFQQSLDDTLAIGIDVHVYLSPIGR
jgi:hypothetical protein